METTPTPTPTQLQRSETDIQVGKILELLKDETALAHHIHELGSNTEIGQVIKDMLEKNGEPVLVFLKEQSEDFTQFFIALITNLIKSIKLNDYVKMYGTMVDGFNVTLWIILKNSNDSFELCSQFYDIYSQVSTQGLFKKLNIDFSVLCEDEVILPPSFKTILP